MNPIPIITAIGGEAVGSWRGGDIEGEAMKHWCRGEIDIPRKNLWNVNGPFHFGHLSLHSVHYLLIFARRMTFIKQNSMATFAME